MNGTMFQLLRNLLLGIFITGLFLWIPLRSIDFSDFEATLRQIRWFYLIVPFICWGIGMLARARRWRILLNEKLAFQNTLSILSLVYMLNATIPLRIGELARLYLVGRSRSGISGWTVLTTVATEMILDMLMIVLLLAFVIPFLAVSESVASSGFLIGSVALIGFVILLGLARKPAIAYAILGHVLRILPILKRLPLESLLEKLLRGITPLANWRTLVNTLFWTVIIWVSSILAIWTAVPAFPDITFEPLLPAALILALVTTSLGMIVPLTVAGVGPFEAAIIFSLGTIGISVEIGMAFGVILHIMMILHFILWGFAGIMMLGLGLVDVRGMKDYIQEKRAKPDPIT